MTTQTAFQAGKPTLTTHPVNGGDALVFTITPPPPQWWWRAMRHRATANASLIRPWDQEHESRIAVVCPDLDKLNDVIDAMNATVEAANRDYEHELVLQRDSATLLRNAEAERDTYLHDVQDAIDARYDRREVGVA